MSDDGLGKMTVTEQERQMIEILREQQTNSEDFSITIEHRDGAWDITFSATIDGKAKRTRGTGASFGQAWDNDRRVDWP
jgi:hypothetical protein